MPQVPHNKMHRPPRIVFFSYASNAKLRSSPTMMGVLKRGLRLIDRQPPDLLETYWIHWGSLEIEDPLIQRTVRAMRPLSVPWQPLLKRGIFTYILGVIREYTGRQVGRIKYLKRVFDRIQPDVIVLGEGPRAGLLNLAHKAALASAIPQLVIDNYYDSDQPQRLTRQWPAVSQWLLVGLSPQKRYGRIGERTVLIPPLLPTLLPKLLPKSVAPLNRTVDLTILGYDPTVIQLGIALLAALPPGTSARLIHRNLLKDQIDTMRASVGNRQLIMQSMPEDQQLRDCLSNSNVVVCKNGFQQMVESLAVGTPVVTYEARGGVPEILLNKVFQPFVRYSTPQSVSEPCLLSTIKQWINHPPAMPWSDYYKEIDDPLQLSSRLFLDAIQTCINKPTHALA